MGSELGEVTGQTGRETDYVYWDDPNEVVNRLRLLWLPNKSGKTPLDNDITSLIDEYIEN